MRNLAYVLGPSFLIAVLWFGMQVNQTRAEIGQAPSSAGQAQPEIWEYAELQHHTRRDRTQASVYTTRWITGTSDESIGANWDNVAEVLKIPAVKQDALTNPTAGAGEAKHRVMVLNHFGIDGWEMCGYSHSTDPISDTWYFKRRVGK